MAKRIIRKKAKPAPALNGLQPFGQASSGRSAPAVAGSASKPQGKTPHSSIYLNGDCSCSFLERTPMTITGNYFDANMCDVIWVPVTIDLPASVDASGQQGGRNALSTVTVEVTMDPAYAGQVVGIKTAQSKPGFWGISQAKTAGVSPDYVLAPRLNDVNAKTLSEEYLAAAGNPIDLALSGQVISVDAWEFYTEGCECCCLDLGCINDVQGPTLTCVNYTTLDLTVNCCLCVIPTQVIDTICYRPNGVVVVDPNGTPVTQPAM